MQTVFATTAGIKVNMVQKGPVDAHLAAGSAVALELAGHGVSVIPD